MNIIIFGLDGADPGLLRDWIDDGYLPNLEKLAQGGFSGKLKSTFPPQTGTAWASFQTGVKPAKHGIYNWLDLTESYQGEMVDRRSIKARTFWEEISSQGGKVGLLSVPLTYPPRRLNGFVIPGFLNSYFNYENVERTHPAELQQKLNPKLLNFNYRMDKYFANSKKDWVNHLKTMINERSRAGLKLAKENLFRSNSEEENNIFMIYFPETDLVQHFLWRESEKGPDYRLEIFKEVDEKIGKFLEHSPSNSNFLVLSDHGFGPAEKTFNVNNWLRKEGYLKLKNTVQTRLKLKLSRLGWNQASLIKPFGEKVYPIMNKLKLNPGNSLMTLSHPALKFLFLAYRDVKWDETRAFTKSDTGQIRLNRAGRECKGIVKNHRARKIQREIIDKLESVDLPGSNTSLARWARPKEEIYSGPYRKDAPDVLLNTLPNKTLSFGMIMFISPDIFIDSLKSAEHRSQGVLIASGPKVSSGERDTRLIDLAPTLLNLLSYPIPEQMDGKVIPEISSGTPRFEKSEDWYKKV